MKRVMYVTVLLFLFVVALLFTGATEQKLSVDAINNASNKGKILYNNVEIQNEIPIPTVVVQPIEVTLENIYTQKEIDLISSVVYFEAMGEPYIGKIYVAKVVLNRVRSGWYGKSVADVVYAGKGSQFNVVRLKKFGQYDEESLNAVRAAFYDTSLPNNMVYFCNVKTSRDSKFVRTVIKPNFYEKIGNHSFAVNPKIKF